jgi:hypothetical protein
MVTKARIAPSPGTSARSHLHPMGKPPRPAPASRLSAAAGPATPGHADGLIRLSGRIPAGGDTQSIIMSPGPRPRPEHPGKAGCPRPPAAAVQVITATNKKAATLNR